MDLKDVEWIFSGIGVLALSAIFYWLRSKSEGQEKSHLSLHELDQSTGQNPESTLGGPKSVSPVSAMNKAETGILFVDDDTKFKVVNILKGHGWGNTRIIKDVSSLEQIEVAAADIFFVDIQGVGKSLQFKDEGLGLVVALKKKYPHKKVVIYSAEAGINAFHTAFKVADDRISKDADPYEFIEVVERLSN